MSTVPAAFEATGLTLGIIVLIVFLSIAGLIFLGSVAVAFMDPEFGIPSAVMVALVAGAIATIGLVPFDSHRWSVYEVSGEVTEAANVLEEASGELTKEPIIRLDSVDAPLYTESRLTTMVGENVTLTCWVEWVHLSGDRYHCKLLSVDSED